MGLYLRHRTWWMDFRYQGRRIRESTETRDRRLAELVMAKRRLDVEAGTTRLTLEQLKTLKLISDDLDPVGRALLLTVTEGEKASLGDTPRAPHRKWALRKLKELVEESPVYQPEAAPEASLDQTALGAIEKILEDKLHKRKPSITLGKLRKLHESNTKHLVDAHDVVPESGP